MFLGLLLTLFACDNAQKSPRLQPTPEVISPQPSGPLNLEIVKPLALLSLGGTLDVRLEAKGAVDEASLIWTLKGEIPAGVVLKSSGSTATLEGTVREPKTYSFTVNV